MKSTKLSNVKIETTILSNKANDEYKQMIVYLHSNILDKVVIRLKDKYR